MPSHYDLIPPMAGSKGVDPLRSSSLVAAGRIARFTLTLDVSIVTDALDCPCTIKVQGSSFQKTPPTLLSGLSSPKLDSEAIIRLLDIYYTR